MHRDDASDRGDLVAGRHAALDQSDRDEAHRVFVEAVAQDEAGDALDGMAWAAWWRGDTEGTLEARQRAYRAYRREGSLRDAARVAAWIGTDLVDFRGSTPWPRAGPGGVAASSPGWILHRSWGGCTSTRRRSCCCTAVTSPRRGAVAYLTY